MLWHNIFYEKGYMYNFDIEKNHVLTFIDELNKKLSKDFNKT